MSVGSQSVRSLLLGGMVLLYFLLPGWVVAQETVQAPPPDTSAARRLVVRNSLPLSDIDIPVRIALKPVYEWADRYVDTLYTSPNYPRDWVMDGCDTRYQYRFVRGPFRFRASNNTLFVAFSGFYGVRGSTRVCTRVGNSPWSPPCTCGFGTEQPRRIDAGFAVQFRLLPDYRLGLTVNRTQPVPVDKCEVCFFGKDITQTVTAQVREELDASITAMQQQLQGFSLQPYLARVWDTLQAAWPMPGFGYLAMQPEAMRISQATLRNDSLFFSLGLSARPELKPSAVISRRPMPALSDFAQRSGFSLFIAQELPYDSLNGLLNQQLGGKDFTVGKGLLRKTVRVESARLMGGGERIFVEVTFSRGIRGTAYMQGKLKWDAPTQEVWIDDLDFELETRQVLLRSAAYLLDGTITKKLQSLTRFNLREKVAELNGDLSKQLNRTLVPGVQSRGALSSLRVEELQAGEKGIYLSAAAKGMLWLDIHAGQLIREYLEQAPAK